MKRKNYSVIFILLAFIIAVTVLCGSYKAKTFAKEDLEFNTKSKSSILLEPNTNTIIFSNNETKRLPIASMCKVMTLLLCFESLDNGEISLDEKKTVSKKASSMGGSQVFLEENGEYLVGELIKSITIASANDSCVAMAERICGDESSFVEKMNEKAKQLGMDNTNFVNCTGLPQPGQYSCALDVAKMYSELIKHQDYFKFSKIWTDKFMHPNDRFTEISNTNKLIRFYQGCEGGKTGYTSEAGHCLVASACRSDMRLISVVICAPNSQERFKEVSQMFNYGFANYVNKLIIDNQKPLDFSVKVIGGKKEDVEVVAEKSIYIFSKRNHKRNFEINYTPLSKIKAPINIGDNLGTLTVYENGVEIESVGIISNENIECKTYFDRLNDICQNWAIK